MDPLCNVDDQENAANLLSVTGAGGDASSRRGSFLSEETTKR